jgi:hypothetical protein
MPEEKTPAPEATTTTISPTEEQSQQLSISDWLQQESPKPPTPFFSMVPCSVHGCKKNVNPVTCKRDEKSGKTLCDKHAFKCPNCGEVRSTEEMRKVPDKEEVLCDDCWSQNYTRCFNCNKEISYDNAYEVENRGYLCETCYNEHYTRCSECGNTINNNYAKYVEDVGYVCKRCFHNNFTRCQECGDIIHIADAYEVEDIGTICDSCFHNNFTACNSCGHIIHIDDARWVENENVEYFCEDCYNEKYTTCYKCDKTIEKDTAYEDEDGNYVCDECAIIECPICHKRVKVIDSTKVDDKSVCNDCLAEYYVRCTICDKPIEKGTEVIDSESGAVFCETCFKYEQEKIGIYKLFIRNEKTFDGFTYTKKDRLLSQLIKYLPISVKDLKSKHPDLANGLQDLISFAKGKTLTKNIVSDYRNMMEPEFFQVSYSRWNNPVQRSRQNINYPQMVMHIIASPEMLSKLQTNTFIFDLFTKINEISKMSGHPMVKNQIGWARLEPDLDGYYILVDEIQSDHANAIHKLKTERNADMQRIKDGLQKKYDLNDQDFNKMLDEYSKLLKDFPNIANQAILGFAKRNGFKKIYWHTYEGSKKLKYHDPPKSLYDKVPKENFFLPSTEKPFGLDAKFMEREARRTDKITKVARKLYLKHFTAISTLDKSSITFKL